MATTKEDRAYAEELAETYCPGVLRVIEAHTPVPHSGGSEITFAMTDDSDAVVRMRVLRRRLRGEARRVDPASGSGHTVRPFAGRQKFAAAVHSAFRERLRVVHPSGRGALQGREGRGPLRLPST
ncbi:hypothetical protein [Streptomyces sp. SID9727]|uniref:hypothetical protein n=1 Tax=Streptomyces sp. SID9727 TaxID=2706114 RepID=UPI001EF27BBA|nr:hypothetical protein [Streptomyces sp. SID9727]